MAPPPPLLRLRLPLLLVLLLGGAELRPPAAGRALPIVDPGLFVIMGVKTCRAGTGYCLLGNDCTLDEDFLPDDRNGHCAGLRSAFTPSAHFVCCRYSAEANATTDRPAAPTDRPPATTDDNALDTTTQTDAVAATTQTGPYDEDSTTTEAVEHRATEQSVEETTTETADSAWSTIRVEDNDSVSDDNKNNESNYVKRSRIELGEEQRSFTGLPKFTVTEITTNPTTVADEDSKSTTKSGDYSVSSSSEQTSKIHSESEDGKKHDSNSVIENHNSADENKNSVYSYTSNGVMMHDILKLITEGEWQISFKNNEVTDEESSDTTTDENYTESLQPSTSYDDQTESTVVTSEEDTSIRSRQNSEDTESPNETTTLTSTEEYAGETTFTPISTPFTNEKESSTVPIQSDLGIETVIKVKDKVENESSKGPSESTTIASNDAANSTTVSSPETSSPNATPEQNDTATALCLGDAIREDDCWLVRFVDERFDSFICHGTMVSHNLILTSAVCAISLYQAGTSNVRAGSSWSAKPDMKVQSIAIHEDYRPRSVDSSRYDLGLISVTSRNACLVCMATPNLKLKPATCHTFASTSQGDGDVKRYQCEEVNVQDDDHHSVKCTLPKQDNLQVHSGAPLVCSGAVAGVAFSSAQSAPSFTPSAQLLPWVRWNLKRLRAATGHAQPPRGSGS